METYWLSNRLNIGSISQHDKHTHKHQVTEVFFLNVLWITLTRIMNINKHFGNDVNKNEYS